MKSLISGFWCVGVVICLLNGCTFGLLEIPAGLALAGAVGAATGAAATNKAKSTETPAAAAPEAPPPIVPQQQMAGAPAQPATVVKANETCIEVITEKEFRNVLSFHGIKRTDVAQLWSSKDKAVWYCTTKEGKQYQFKNRKLQEQQTKG